MAVVAPSQDAATRLHAQRRTLGGRELLTTADDTYDTYDDL